MKNFKHNNKSGFTLIETFVAVLILVFAVIGPLGLLSRAIADGNYAKNQVTAYYLAQEAIEQIINQRDRNLQEGRDWLDDTEQYECSSRCALDIDNQSGGIEIYVPNNKNKGTSIFSRFVNIVNNDDGSGEVGVTVSWSNKTQEADFELIVTLYDKEYRE